MKYFFALCLVGCAGDVAAVSSAAHADPSSAAAAVTPAGFQPVIAKSWSCFRDEYRDYPTAERSFRQRFAKPLAKQPALASRFLSADTYQRYQQHIHCESFVYQVDGAPVVGYLLMPKTASASAPEPVLIYNRGGNGQLGALNLDAVFALLMPLAEQGYVVLASNYRGLHNRLKASKAELDDQFGGADVADVLALKDYIARIPAADGQKVAMMGHSRGGMQSWLAAKQWPELDALVIVAGVTDLQLQLTTRPEMENVYRHRIPDYDQQKTAALQQRSVSHFLPQVRADLPVLLIHGDKDERVDVGQALLADKLLTARGQPHQLLLVPGGDHSLRQQMPVLLPQIRQFLQAQLK